MGVLDRDDVARLRGVTLAAIKKTMQRYPEGASGGFPTRDDTKNGGPVWNESRTDELRTWVSPRPGGRPRKTAAAGTPATGAQTPADGTSGTTGAGQSTPDTFAPLAPLRPINDRATSDVFHNLQRQKDKRDLWGTAGETFSFESREVYREQAMSWLGDNSELTNRTIEAADWNEVFDYFRALRHGADTTTPEPAPEPFSNRRLSDDPAHEGMTSLAQIIAYEHRKAKEKRITGRREAKHRKAMEASTVTDPATAVKVSVDVVEPGKAVIVGPGFQGRAGVDTDAKTRRYWVELSSSDTHPDDVEQIIGTARTYAATGEVLANHHGLTNYYVDVEHER